VSFFFLPSPFPSPFIVSSLKTAWRDWRGLGLSFSSGGLYDFSFALLLSFFISVVFGFFFVGLIMFALPFFLFWIELYICYRLGISLSGFLCAVWGRWRFFLEGWEGERLSGVREDGKGEGMNCELDGWIDGCRHGDKEEDERDVVAGY
jgi:hypothetical protein